MIERWRLATLAEVWRGPMAEVRLRGRRYHLGHGEPTVGQLADGAANADLRAVDVENLAPHYARTPACWSANYEAAWDRVVEIYEEVFARMWRLYLKGAEGAFRWGGLQLWQAVLSHRAEFPLAARS